MASVLVENAIHKKMVLSKFKWTKFGVSDIKTSNKTNVSNTPNRDTTGSEIIAGPERPKLDIFLPRTLTGLPMTRCNEMSRTE